MATTVPAVLLDVKAVQKRLTPEGGRPPHYNTIRRWITEGIENCDHKAYLAAVKIGGRIMVPEAALVEFIDHLSQRFEPDDSHSMSIRALRARKLEMDARVARAVAVCSRKGNL